MKRASMHSLQRGFTVVELLIVIIVIAILAVITIVAYNGIRQRALLSQHVAALSQYGKQYQAYVSLEGSSPYDISLGTGSGPRYGCIFPKTSCYNEWSPETSTALQTKMSTITSSDPAFVWVVAMGNRDGVDYLFSRFAAGTAECPEVSGLARWESEIIPSNQQLHCRYILMPTP